MGLPAPHRRWITLAVLLGAVAGGVVTLWATFRSPDSLLAGARDAIARHEYDRALALARRAADRDEPQLDALLTAARAARLAGHSNESFTFLRRIPPDSSSPGVVDVFKQAGQQAIRMG